MSSWSGWPAAHKRGALWLLLGLLVALSLDTRINAGFAAESKDNGTAQRAAESSLRRARVMERMGQGMAILISGEPKNFSNDVDYPFRQENNLYYLTGVNQPGATLVLMPGSREPQEVLFLPKREPSQETWTGHMLSAVEAERLSGIKQIWEATELEAFLDAALTGKRYEKRSFSWDVPRPAEPSAKDSLEVWLIQARGSSAVAQFQREKTFGDTLSARYPRLRKKDLLPIFADLRLIKSPYEVAQLRSAIELTADVHRGVMTLVKPGMNESELDGFIYAGYRRRGAQWGFPSIVASGPNATTLHYEDNSRQIQDGDLVAIDIGAEIDHYSADVTRTIPANGRFTREQRTIYEIVFRAQEAGLNAARPGATIRSVHSAALGVLKTELLRIGLVTDTTSNQYRMWFMHGTSHWLGLDVHDPGARDTLFQPGMVLTVEPGLYIREDALDYLEKTPENETFLAAVRPAFERYKNIGVRIEDDILITNDGYEALSMSAPRTVQEIETFMRVKR